MKRYFYSILVWMIFGSVAGRIIQFVLPQSTEMVGIGHMVLPCLSIILFVLILQIKELFAIIMYLLSLPFRLFRWKNKKEEVEDGTDSSTRGDEWLIIPLSMLLYGIAGWIFGRYHGGEYWLITHLIVGLCWGIMVLLGFQKGILSEDELRRSNDEF